MKRSPMPARKAELRRGEGPKRKTWMSSGGKALERKAAKKPKPRPKTAPKSAIDLVKDRSLGLCEIGLKCFGNAPATETAHRRGKGSGGVGKKNTTSNTASNLLRGCSADHAHIDNAEVADAERLGLKLRHTKAHPYEMPVYHYRLGWVLLDDQGGHRPAPEASWDRSMGGLILPVVTLTWGPDPDGGAGLWLDDGPVYEAMQRFGHLDCGRWKWSDGEPLECTCGAFPFVVEVAP